MTATRREAIELLERVPEDKLTYVVQILSGIDGLISISDRFYDVTKGSISIDDEDIRDYDGAEVIVTLLNYPQRKAKKAPVDWDSFVIPSERGLHVDEYMKEMRENDRL